MNHKEAKYLVFGNNKDSSDALRDELYQKEHNRLSNLISTAPVSLKENHLIELERLEKAYKIILEGTSGIAIKPPEKPRVELEKENSNNDHHENISSDKESRGFLKTLMSHKGVFFLTLSCLTAAFLLAIKWSEQNAKIVELEQLASVNSQYEELLTNKPLKLLNMGEDSYKVLGYTVFYFDEKNKSIEKYYKEDLKDEFILKPQKTGYGSAISITDLTSDLKNTAFDGEALFFSLILQNTRTGKAQSWMDYVGAYNNEKGTINLNLE